MKIEKEKLSAIGFNPEIDLSSVEDSMTKNRKLASRILSGSLSFYNITKKGYGDFVKVDKSLLGEFNQDFIGDLKVINDEGSKKAIIGRKDSEEILEINIL
jgi:hypothetical protein